MQASHYYERGQLDKAIQAAGEALKAQPANIAYRNLLAELLCINHDYERADKQLDIIALQDANAQLGVALQRQLIRAAQARQQCYLKGRLPEFVQQPTAGLLNYLKALLAFRKAEFTEVKNLLTNAETSSLSLSGYCNGASFQAIRDLNDLTAGVVELMTRNGKYYWLAWEQIACIEFAKPARPIDLVWRRAHIEIHNGPEGEVYLPCNYFTVDNLGDEAIRLGRKTEWEKIDHGFTLGYGQKMFLVGEQALSMLELESLSIVKNQ